MSVHIGDLHTEIVSIDGSPAQDGDDPRDSPERVRDAIERTRWLASRVAAEGFDD